MPCNFKALHLQRSTVLSTATMTLALCETISFATPPVASPLKLPGPRNSNTPKLTLPLQLRHITDLSITTPIPQAAPPSSTLAYLPLN